MGADLYNLKMEAEIEKEFPWDHKDYNHPNFSKRYRVLEERGGYYRDAYNNSNLMWLIGFSYWKSPETLGWRFRKDGRLSVKGTKQFLAYLEENDGELRNKITALGDPEEREFFYKKIDRLKFFLQKCIEMGSAVCWSV